MRLSDHLVVRTRPAADPKNLVFWRNYRVTVLGTRLFRLEHSPAKKFRDGATQTVWFRDMSPTDHVVTQDGEACIIQTAACKLILREKREDCTVDLGGGEIKLDNEGNLLGTYRTLDGCDGDAYTYGKVPEKIKLGAGVCSLSGVALFDDEASLTLGEDGEVKPEWGDGTDEYIFAFGSDYRGAVRALYQITGPVPMIPRYALGNWWSRYHAYSDKEYLKLLNRFAAYRVPLSVATIDMDWHYSYSVEEDCGLRATGRNTRVYGVTPDNVGWTGYTWNKHLFPDRVSFLEELGRRGLKATLNLHPSGGVRWWEAQYGEMSRAMGRDPEKFLPVAFDFSDPAFINAYFSILHKPYEREGVEFWWIDWQQGTQSAMEGLDPLWALNHYHYLDAAENHPVPLILSRYAGIGSHRYPVGFSGDTLITWKTLGYLPYFTATASNIGYTWWSHDIGGHQQGETDGELYVRFIQFGVFSPIDRLHSACSETVTKEPFAYSNGVGEIAANFLRLRHRLVPYLYTAAHRTHEEGIALIEPLYYRNREEEAYRFENEYYFGSELLVAPVTEKRRRDGYARVKVWLPEGIWTDIFTGERYEIGAGGQKKTILRTLDEMPVFAKAGAVLPLSRNEGNGTKNPEKLEARVFRGDGHYTLYEDTMSEDGVQEFYTDFDMVGGEGVQKVKISSHGNAAAVPENRRLLIWFADIPEGEVKLLVNGKEEEIEPLLSDELAVEFAFEAGKEYTVEATFTPPTAAQQLIRSAHRILTRAECNNDRKEAVWQTVRLSESVAEYASAVRLSMLPAEVKDRLMEAVPKRRRKSQVKEK